jgi:hypothetical protein
MSLAQKLVGGLVLIGAVTTMVLPGRQTVPVINAFTGLIKGSFGTVMGTAKPV